ncbi:MAG: hypothetical protein ACOCUU_00320 [Nanoarchaeota archaeon]
MPKRKFPALATLLLIFGVAWLASEIYNIAIDLPWLPTILIVIAIAMIYNRLRE